MPRPRRKLDTGADLKPPAKSPSKATKATKAPAKPPAKTPTKTPTKTRRKLDTGADLKPPAKSPTKTPTKTLTKSPSKPPVKSDTEPVAKSPTKSPAKPTTTDETAPSSTAPNPPTTTPTKPTTSTAPTKSLPPKAPKAPKDVTCNCVKSKCLLLYCDCFHRGLLCKEECVCIDCKNVSKASLVDDDEDGGEEGVGVGGEDGVGVGAGGGVGVGGGEGVDVDVDVKMEDVVDAEGEGGDEDEGKATKKRGRKSVGQVEGIEKVGRAAKRGRLSAAAGCSCVNSACLKKYCVCFNAQVECGFDRCKCRDCKNPHGSISAPKRRASYISPAGINPSTALGASLKSKTSGGGGGGGADGAGADGGSGGTPAKSRKIKALVRKPKNKEKELLSTHTPKRGRQSKSQEEEPRQLSKLTTETTKCSCTKTHCLKLYCDCFRQSLYCEGEKCSCTDCKNTKKYGGPHGERSKARREIMERRPGVFQTPKKRSGSGCSCAKNKCRSGYCDCFTNGLSCDPAICSCTSCGNMMEPLSEAPHLDPSLYSQYEDSDEEEEVYALSDEEDNCKIKNLRNYYHLINDFDLKQVENPSNPSLVAAYQKREEVAEKARTVLNKEAHVRANLEYQVRKLEKELQEALTKEEEALNRYRETTNKVLCLEMEEPCRWNELYNKLKSYVMETGHLPPVPSSCTGENERRLSIWIEENKSLMYTKNERIVNAPHRIEALEILGVEWIESEEERWGRMLRLLGGYKRKHGTVKLPSFLQCRMSKDPDLIALRHWVDAQEQACHAGTIKRDRLHKLQALGLPFKLSWKQEWDKYVEDLLKFRSKFGHCYVDPSCKDYPGLDRFVEELMNRLKKDNEVTLTIEERKELREKGLLLELRRMLKRPLGRPSAKIIVPAQRVPIDKVKEVNVWAGKLAQLKAYKAEFNSLRFPPPDKESYDETQWRGLREWVKQQRAEYANKTLDKNRIRELHKIGLDLDEWDSHFKSLRKYKREGGTVRLPRTLKQVVTEDDEKLAELCRWVFEQLQAYRKGTLDGEKKDKLRKLGVKLTKHHLGQVAWEDRLEEVMEYFKANNTCYPKKDGPLRQWVLELAHTLENSFLAQEKQKMIDDSGLRPYLTTEVLLSAARSEE